MLGGEQEMIDLLFEASIADVLDEYLTDQRLKDALFGQGVIGTWGGPKDPGTASIKLMHYQGDLEGQGPVWGYVEGGMGMISFAIADAAREAGAVLACGVPVAEILPEEGVRTEDGTTIRAATVLCNADPKVALRLLGDAEIEPGYRARLEAWKVRSPVVKFNAALVAAAELDRRARRGLAGAGDGRRHRRGRRARRRVRGLRRAASPRSGSARSTCRPATTRRPAPPGNHLMSVFGQYAPYDLAEGDWDARRGDVERQFVDLIGRFAPDFADCLDEYEVLGPPDIESRIGLTGGNIFQGEVTPGPDVGGQAAAADPGPRPLPLRRRDPSGGERDRPQRPQRRRRDARRPGARPSISPPRPSRFQPWRREHGSGSSKPPAT